MIPIIVRALKESQTSKTNPEMAASLLGKCLIETADLIRARWASA